MMNPPSSLEARRSTRSRLMGWAGCLLVAGSGCSTGGYSAAYQDRVKEYEALGTRLANPVAAAAPAADGQPEGDAAAPPKPDDPMTRLYDRARGGGAAAEAAAAPAPGPADGQAAPPAAPAEPATPPGAPAAAPAAAK
ncbi:MAG: hypothetical protein ACKOCN_11800 [Planctomycetaceae bacterium]